jgi:hypothetical protein
VSFSLPLNDGHILGLYRLKIVLDPYRYLIFLPSKGFREQAIDSLNMAEGAFKVGLREARQ